MGKRPVVTGGNVLSRRPGSLYPGQRRQAASSSRLYKSLDVGGRLTERVASLDIRYFADLKRLADLLFAFRRGSM